MSNKRRSKVVLFSFCSVSLLASATLAYDGVYGDPGNALFQELHSIDTGSYYVPGESTNQSNTNSYIPSYTPPSYTPPSFSSSGFDANNASGSGNVFAPAKTVEPRADLGGFVRKIECCEDLEHFLNLLQSEGLWKTNRAGNVVHFALLKEPPKMVDGVEVAAETGIRYTIDLDQHTATLGAEKSGTTVAFEFGRYRSLFKGKLESLATKKFETFVWQLEERDIDAILDMLLSNKDVKHRPADGSERITSNVLIDGFKCVETVVLDRKNSTAEVTVSCAPLRLKAAVTQKDLKEAQKRAAENDAAVKVYETQRASERKAAELLQKANAGDFGAIRQLADQCRAANDEAGALGWYHKAVDLGHAEVADEVADRLLTGRGFAKAPQKALEWYRLSYEKGNKAIPLKLAEKYLKGDGFAKNEEKALEWYTTVYKDGDKSIAPKLAEMYQNGNGFVKNEDKAAEWYTTAYKDANKNVKRTLAKKLAEMYLRGKGFAKSEENALKWYETAYKAGDGSLAPKLAEMYLRGDGFAKSEESALKWYETAYKAGNRSLAQKFAEMYLRGDGVAKSEENALKWYVTAYKAGNKSLAQKLAKMYLRGDGFAKSEENALKWYETAYKDGYRTVAFELAEMYRKGDGFAKSEENALKWYETAYRSDSSVAAKLAELYLRGDGIAKSEDKALEWYRKAVETNDKTIALAVARRLRKGEGFAANIDKAIEWYSLAAEKGLTEAAREAAEMYRFGRDVTKDEDAALSWYRRLVDIQGEQDEEKLHQWQLIRGNFLSPPSEPKSESAQTARQIADDLLNGKDFTLDEKKAMEWYVIAHRQRDKSAADFIRSRGEQYRRGDSRAKIKQDNVMALEWYQKWVDVTEDNGQKILNIKNVAGWLKNGRGFKKDGKAAVEWYQKAVDLGDVSAMKEIADLYRSGAPNAKIQQDNAKALEWYQKWVDATEDTNQKILNIKQVAYWLKNGNGFKADGKAAIEWYQKAVDLGDEGAAKEIEKLRKRK